jgi:hypothetical protein
MEPELLKELANKLNLYLATKGDSQRFAKGGGCGSGESYVKVMLKPLGATFSYIPTLKFRMCEVRKIDPFSSRCDGWLNGGPQLTQYNAGRYYFQVFFNGQAIFKGEKHIKATDSTVFLP